MKKVYISYIFYTIKTAWGQIDPKQHLCVKHVYRTLKTYHHVHFVFTQLSPLDYEKSLNMKQKKTMLIIYLETLNIEKGQIDPKHNRRVKRVYKIN